jgi:hypothetical protein
MASDPTQPHKANLDLSVTGEEASVVLSFAYEDGNNASNFTSGDAPSPAGRKQRVTELSWGATEDLLCVAQIINSVVKQETGKMEEPEGGHWKIWVAWFQTTLLAHARTFKDGNFQNIKPYDKVNRIFNVMIGSSLSTPIGKKFCAGA